MKFQKNFIFFQFPIAFFRKIGYNILVNSNELNSDEDRARAIEACEPCQMGNQAAISSHFDVLR